MRQCDARVGRKWSELRFVSILDSIWSVISEANNHAGPDTILFNIPGGGVQTIQLTSKLPSLWDGSGGTTIDGYSQPGAQPNTDSLVSSAQIMIQLRGNGAGAFDLLQITSAGNVVRGLAMFNARRSVWLYGSGAHNNIVAGNFLVGVAFPLFAVKVAQPLKMGHPQAALGIGRNVLGNTALSAAVDEASEEVKTGGGLAFYGPEIDTMAVQWGSMGLAVSKAAP